MRHRILVTPKVAKRTAVWVLLLWLILVGATANTAAAQRSPTEVVTNFQQKLVNVWRSDANFEQRFESLAPAIVASHALAAMARFTLGTQWQKLSLAQREQFLTTFRRLTIATYAKRFADYNGGHFVRLSERKLSPDKYLVRTRLLLDDGTRIRLDYLLHQQDSQWAIINVLADGVSQLAIMRSQYAEIIRDQGFAALIEELQRRLSDMADEQQAAYASSVG